MGITIFNGMPIYTISKEDIERMGLSYNPNPTYFAKAIETWEEGEKKASLSAEELDTLKQKYNSNTMTRKDSVDLLGELVKAGIMSIAEARSVYICGVPLDESKMQYGFLQKEYISGTNSLRDAWKAMNAESRNIYDNLDQKMGYDYFKTAYEIAKMDTNIDDPDNDPYFLGWKQYLDILEALQG